MPDYLKDAYRLGPRQYDGSCPVGSALNLLGDRWTLSLLKELQFGARRFSDLKGSLPGLSARALSLRLGQLEDRELVTQVRLFSPTSVNVYQLTDRGLRTRPIIVEMVRWAVASGAFDPAGSSSSSSLAMSLLALFQPNALLPQNANIRFVSPELTFTLHISDGMAAITINDHEPSGAEMAGSVPALAGYIFGYPGPVPNIDHKWLNCRGDRELIENLPLWFDRSNDSLQDA
jgi:DNA-binding HxlR family transcriptional regulator